MSNKLIRRKCSFCRGKKHMPDLDNQSMEMFLPVKDLLVIRGRLPLKEEEISVKIKFCPLCGLKLY